MNSLDMEVPADVCTFPCDKPCNPPSSPTAPSSPPPRLIEDFLFSHPSNNLNLPGANTPLSPRCYTALHMAGLSVHTKLVLGPRRARSSLRPGGGCRAGGGGWRGGGPGGGVGALGAAVRHLLASAANLPGVCFATVWRRLQVAHAVTRQERCQGLASPLGGRGGGRRDGPLGGAPPCATRCPGGLLLVRPPPLARPN